MFKTISHNCFYLKSASSLVVSDSQASKVTGVHAQPSTSLILSVCNVLGSALQGEQSRWAGGGETGIGPRVCGGDSDRSWHCLMEHPWILDIAAGFRTHLSQPTLNIHFKETHSLPGVFFGFVWAAVCFLFWLCSLMIKAAFDTSAALNAHLLFLLAHPSLDTSLSISASCYVFASSYLITVSLFCKSFSSMPTLFLCRLPKGSIICHSLLPFFLLVQFSTLITSSTPQIPNCP